LFVVTDIGLIHADANGQGDAAAAAKGGAVAEPNIIITGTVYFLINIVSFYL
jgi:hypothetical protein